MLRPASLTCRTSVNHERSKPQDGRTLLYSKTVFSKLSRPCTHKMLSLVVSSFVYLHEKAELELSFASGTL